MSILDASYGRKVVVTGASGFVGGRLRQALLDAGADVVSLVRPSSPPARVGRSAAVDYEDVASVRAVFEREKPDVVIHAAGATKGVTYDDFRRGNVRPTESLVQALSEVHPQVSRFVLVSSGSSYGPNNEGPPKRETDAREPIEHYGHSKLEAERVVEGLGDALPWTIVRPVSVYGPGDVDFFTLFQAAYKRVNLFYGNREKRASFIYVDDLVRAIMLTAEHEAAVGRGFFVCDGEPRTWGDLQHHIARAVGRRGFEVNLPSFVVGVAARAGEAMTALDKKPRILNRQKAVLDAQSAWEFDSSAIRRELGFTPRVRVPEGTRLTYRWYRDHGWL